MVGEGERERVPASLATRQRPHAESEHLGSAMGTAAGLRSGALGRGLLIAQCFACRALRGEERGSSPGGHGLLQQTLPAAAAQLPPKALVSCRVRVIISAHAGDEVFSDLDSTGKLSFEQGRWRHMSSPQELAGLVRGCSSGTCPALHSLASSGAHGKQRGTQPVVQGAEGTPDEGTPASHVPGVSLCAARGRVWGGGSFWRTCPTSLVLAAPRMSAVRRAPVRPR